MTILLTVLEGFLLTADLTIILFVLHTVTVCSCCRNTSKTTSNL